MSQARTIGLAILACVFSVAWSVVTCVDITRWQTGPLCEQRASCAPPTTNPECDAMSAALRTLFGWSMGALTAEGTKTIMLLTHCALWFVDTPTPMAIAPWVFAAVVSASTLGLTIYRYGILMLLTSEYEDDLYPTTKRDVQVPSHIAIGTLAAVLGTAIVALEVVLPFFPTNDDYQPVTTDVTELNDLNSSDNNNDNSINKLYNNDDEESRAKIA